MNNFLLDETKYSEFDIAVIGMDCRFPDADSPEAFWKNLKNGLESVVSLSEEELLESGVSSETFNQPNYVKRGAFISEYDMFAANFFGFSAKEAAMMDPQHRIFLEICWHAMEKAGYDGEQYKGSIGVFAGATFNSYLLNNVLKGRSIMDSADNFFIQILNDKDNLSTRISYKLNLNGPALSIQTACSTSLVSVHYACQSLLNHECDIALAGGVTVRSPQKTGYFYQPDMILSKDGHCRPFDQDASGTVFGNGAGVVVLKRLEEAVKDGDVIHAIIKGSSVNNDGAEKVGYTAPGRIGQETVIENALALAGVAKETITAIEAHGTGTALGDPIEFESLKKVYGSTNNKIAIGSVKSNIGHLECAAGIASFIKMVLCLKNKTLVPSLNYNNPNPHLSIQNTPFYVNTQTREWNSPEGEPLRCAISSFGIGGTNAHLILEEGIKPCAQEKRRPTELVTFSAKSQWALNKTTDNMIRFLKQNPDTDYSALAHTLRSGRRSFDFRLATVASDVDSLISALEDSSSKHKWTSYKKLNDPQIVFMFPGQGSQYVNMAKEIYHNEPVFRKELDRGAEVLKKYMGLDIRDILFPGDNNVEEARKQLTMTNITQPVLFVIEYSMACLWMSWGINPSALIGHSIGEYAAACISGVFSYDDGLAIVAKRGELINSLPAGSMIGLSISENEVKPLLTERISIASVNGPTFTVVSGTKEDIEIFAQVLKEKDIKYSLLHTSHGFHSWMMEPAFKPFEEFVKGIKLNSPLIPYISNITGSWITEEQATSPQYWARHIVAPVRFSEGATQLLKNEKNVYIEAGPGITLSTFMKNHDPKVNCVSCLPHAAHNSCSLEHIYSAGGKLWVMGASFDWQGFVKEDCTAKIELPVYPFEKKNYWIKPAAINSQESIDDIKIDVQADVINENMTSENKQGPRNETEKAVMEVFSRVLGIGDIGIKDNFFELGGHSLLAIQLLTKVNEMFNTEIKLNDFFKFATVEGLAEAISDTGSIHTDEDQEILKFPEVVEDLERRYDAFPLTEMQEAQWLGRIASFSVGNVAAHVYYETEKEDIDITRLQKSWQIMIDRHEMLRTVLLPEGGQQILKGPLNYSIRNLDLRNADPETAQKEALRVRSEIDHVVRPIDKWPLFEVRTTQMPGNKVRIHFSIDLLICDVGSMRIIQSEWAKVYKNIETELPKLNLSFRDYVLAESKLKNSEAYIKANEYWDKRVMELPLTTAPELPVAKDISTIGNVRFKRWSFVVDSKKWEMIKSAAVKQSLSPSSVILAAFSQILGLWSKTPQFCVNTPIINRLPVHPQVKQIVGEFASFAPVVVSLKDKKTFAQLAQEVQQNSWENLENRFVSGTSILRKLAKYRGGSSGAVFPVVFTSTIVQKVEGEDEFQNQFGGYSYLISQTPQVWLDHTAMENEKGLLLSWHAIAEMFPEGMLDSMWNAYEEFMNRLADDNETWNSHYNELIPKGDIDLREEANNTQKEFNYELLHKPIIEQAKLRPEKTAIITQSKKITYGELVGYGTGIGLKLREEGLNRAELVAVIMEKGYEQVVGVLGALQGGGAYLPLDPDLPKERLKFILKNSKVRFVLTQEKHSNSLGWLNDEGMYVIALSEPVLNDIWTSKTLSDIQEVDDLAYVIFTSGSTGNPKGVMITHLGAQNTILDVNQKFNIKDTDSCFALSELNFDLSVYDIFGILAAGGTMVIPNANTSRDPEHWLDLISTYPVTVWNSVPALMAMLVEFAQSKNSKLPLRLVMMSGDWIPVNLPSRIKELSQDVEVISLGGATEAAIWSNYYHIKEVDSNWTSIPYGKPLANQKFYVLNKDLSPCPVWVPGELYIGGMGVALGYINEPELTENAFIIHPVTKERLYKTGDLGRYMPDGNLEFLGRDDFQVKISGFRVELEDIEAAMLKHSGVKAAVVNAVGETRDKKRLVGYIVPDEGNNVDFSELKQFLSSLLPEYMVPNEYVSLDSFPLTPNGKVNRKALPEPKINREKDKKSGEPSGAVVKKLVSIFSEVLKVEEDQIDINANFFSLGGDSIMGIQIISRAAKEGIEISPQMFFERTTISELAEVINVSFLDMEEDDDEKGGPLPLGSAQKWILDTYGEAEALNWWAVLKVLEPMEPQKVEMTFQYLSMKNTALQVQFMEKDGIWEQLYPENKSKPEIDYVDISGMNEKEVSELIVQIRNDMEKQQELEASPLVKLCIFDNERQGKQFLLFVWNQIILDLRSFEVFLKEFDLVYKQIAQGSEIITTRTTKKFRHWLQNQDSTSGIVDKNVDSQVHILGQIPQKLYLGEPDIEKVGYSGICYRIQKGINWDSDLEASKISGEELFVTALTLALEKMECCNEFYADCICVPSNELLQQNGFQNVIGQMSQVFTVNMNIDGNQQKDEIIRTVKEKVRMYKSLGETSTRAKTALPQIKLSYSELGDMKGTNFTFEESGKYSVEDLPEKFTPYALEIDVVREIEGFVLYIEYNSAIAKKEFIESLCECIGQMISELVDYICKEDVNLFIPGDFPDMEMEDCEFNKILEMLQ